MKQYLLLLKSADFNKSDNIWTSNAINLYSNSQYSNYSYARSRYGLNLIGDNTYVGTEVTSPSYSQDVATPISNNAIYVTDAGEIVYDSATPDLLRFLDTTSKIDILAYKHVFTNVPGDEVPSFNIQLYESDEENGPWLKSPLSFDSNAIFIRDSKPWIKIELEIFSENTDISTLGLLFYLEIGIHTPTSPIISNSARNILRRFPTWTKLFEDSLDPATPSLAIPASTGGKFLTSLVQENIDNVVTEIDLYGINTYINSADENMLAWVYVTYNIPVNLLSVIGDGVPLSPVDSLATFYKSKLTDHIYYYNPIDRQLLVIQEYGTLTVNGSVFEQYPINIFNNFDEFGLKLGLPRLYKESNSRYKKRILDVSKNMPATNVDGLKRTLRRELDIWKVYGVEPDSNYLGATPDIIEISDIESTTPYFSYSGHPQKVFKDLVEDLNNRYPSNLDYVRWDEGNWDYAGLEGQGVGRIPAIYDVSTSPLGSYYQPGVGDFSDARLMLESIDKSTVSFNGHMEISGAHKTGIEYAYMPIAIDYTWYLNYRRTVQDYDAGRRKSGVSQDVGVGLTYEIVVPAHDNYATPSTFYANLNYTNRNDFYVGNRLPQTSSASPEFNYIRIFDQEGNTVPSITFRDKVYNQIYYNSHSSPITNNINFYDASQVRVVYSNGGWNYVTQSYDLSLATANYRARFNQATASYYVMPAANTTISMSSPNMRHSDADLRIGSTDYSTKVVYENTDVLRSSFILNSNNDTTVSGLTPKNIYVNDLLNRVIYPSDATPLYLHVDINTPRGLAYFGESSIQQSTPGGRVINTDDNSEYLVPSSPNILWQPFNSSDVATDVADYFTSATINYSSTPSYIKFESATSSYYPIYFNTYESFTTQTTPNLFSGYIDSLENVYENYEQSLNTYFNSDSFLTTIYVNKDSFGLTSEDTYIIKDVNFVSNVDNIQIYPENNNRLLSDINTYFSQNNELPIGISAKRDVDLVQDQRPALHTGWLYVNENEYYVYANPATDSATGKFFSIKLNNTPRNGSPIIVSVSGEEYRNIVFEDSATPGKLSFSNTETVSGSYGNSIYLAYKDVFGASVIDKYTGKELLSGQSTESNSLSMPEMATPFIYGRDYLVNYYVNNSWYIDNNVYDSVNDEYNSYIYFSSTPNTESIYRVTYENSINDNTYPINLEVSSSLNPVDEGYIYLSNNDYAFSHIDAYLSPSNISDSESDLMYLSIVSYDTNGNLKPGQTFSITGDLISATPSYVTTSDNGLATSIIRYNGDIPSIYNNGTIDIIGIGSATPNGGVNSESQGYSDVLSFKINRNNPFHLGVKAAPSDLNVNADGLSRLSISGKVFWKDKPFNHSVAIAWNKARTLKDLFAATPDYLVNTNSSGEFTITNAITASDSATPGYWFARVNIAYPENVSSLLTADGETLLSNDVTISGDVIYWHESYDTIQYSYENDVPLPNIYRVNKQENSDILATPYFMYNHSDSTNVYAYSTTPNWIPPRWVPLNKFDQYQMGLMGSTPYYISDYSLIHPDHEEQ